MTQQMPADDLDVFNRTFLLRRLMAELKFISVGMNETHSDCVHKKKISSAINEIGASKKGSIENELAPSCIDADCPWFKRETKITCSPLSLC